MCKSQEETEKWEKIFKRPGKNDCSVYTVPIRRRHREGLWPENQRRQRGKSGSNSVTSMKLIHLSPAHLHFPGPAVPGHRESCPGKQRATRSREEPHPSVSPEGTSGPSGDPPAFPACSGPKVQGLSPAATGHHLHWLPYTIPFHGPKHDLHHSLPRRPPLNSSSAAAAVRP